MFRRENHFSSPPPRAEKRRNNNYQTPKKSERIRQQQTRHPGQLLSKKSKSSAFMKQPGLLVSSSKAFKRWPDLNRAEGCRPSETESSRESIKTNQTHFPSLTFVKKTLNRIRYGHGRTNVVNVFFRTRAVCPFFLSRLHSGKKKEKKRNNKLS